MFLLDTNAVIALLKNRPPTVREYLRRASSSGDELAISVVVLFELWYGVARSGRRSENADRLRVFLSGSIGVIPFEEADAHASPFGLVNPIARLVRRSYFMSSFDIEVIWPPTSI